MTDADGERDAETASDLLSEAQRALTRQEASLDSLRSRGERLVGASTVLAGLFAVATQTVASWQVATKGVAITLAVGVIVIFLIIERPQQWTFEKQIIGMINDVRGQSPDPTYTASNATLALALGLAEAHEKNEPRIHNLTNWYRGGICLVLAQIVFWILTVL